MEFLIRRDLYYWALGELNKMDEFEPKLVAANVIEYGRLNVENNFLSKRKIKKLCQDGLVTGHDDPRLLTISGLRRRGFTNNIIRDIVRDLSTSRNDNLLTESAINFHLRNHLDETCDRMFAVLDPIRVDIIGENNITNNVTDDGVQSATLIDCHHPNHPKKDPANNYHITKLSNKIYIERDDFREQDDKKYYRLAPNKTVRLRYAGFIEYVSHHHTPNMAINGITDMGSTEVVTDMRSTEKSTEGVTDMGSTEGTNNTNLTVVCRNVEPANWKKIKGVIHWVSEEDSVECIFELFDKLLNDDGTFNDRSKITRRGRVEKTVMTDLTRVYQFERVGYFKFDRLLNGVPVFIRVVELQDRTTRD